MKAFFLKNRTKIDLEDMLSPVSNMASSCLKKMLDIIIVYTHKSVSENVCPVILLLDTKQIICHMLGRCFCLKKLW